jgi:hypothetical protein
MKHLKAKNNYPGYTKVTMSMDDIVPASIYREVPDADSLKEEIEQGVMHKPLMLWPMTQKYWKDVHLRYYRKTNPDLPEVAPEKDGEVMVVWKGRQRYQLAREMGYTHVDCVVEKEQHKIVAIAQQEKIK